MSTMQLTTVTMDCPVCGSELEVVCRYSGQASRWTHADTREVEIVTVQCDGGCDLTGEQRGIVTEEAVAEVWWSLDAGDEGW